MLVACDGESVDAPPNGSLSWAIAGPWRLDAHRDRWRRPLQTLLFWGLTGEMTVLEVLPGRGWYTSILAPYLASNGGKLIAASFDPNSASPARREVLAAWEDRFGSNEKLFGDIERAIVAPGVPLAAPGSVDLAILANVLHTLMAEGGAERVFADVAAALKPGGVLGVEQHRASSGGMQSPSAESGYVQEAYVRALAQESGLEFVQGDDINANPRDTRDHPFGVWTLPPDLRTAPLGQPPDDKFDTSPYEAIGESDRMTLKFRKPFSDRPAATQTSAAP
jgi:predicted methyltransferase